jgi:hypothetical protein
LAAPTKGFEIGPAQLPVTTSPFFEVQTMMFSVEGPAGLCGMSTTFAL